MVVKNRLCIRHIVLILVLLAFTSVTIPQTLAESIVYGQVYDWSTFDVINYSIVEVDTIPVQKVVSTDGSYSLKIPKGNYTISATSGYGSRALYGYENITVPGTGEYEIDLLLFPDNNLTALEIFGQNLPSPTPTAAAVNNNIEIPGSLQDSLSPVALAIIALVILASSAVAGFVILKRKKPAATLSKQDTRDACEELRSTDDGQELEHEPLEATAQTAGDTQQDQATQPVDLQQVMPKLGRILKPDCKSVITTIDKNGGRITQLELRKMLPYSEAKISLIISELEDAGYLKKIKRGRGNVLILTYQDYYNSERPQE